jgi:uncharacterized protein YdaU (DUF1376 family)
VGDDRVKRPAYQWNVLDARGDEVYMLMTYEQRGVYRELLDQQWLEGSLPPDQMHLAALLRMPRGRLSKLWPLISTKFRVRDDGRLVNDRLEQYREQLIQFREIQAEKGRKGAKARWPGHSQSNAQAMPADSSLSLTKTVLPKTKEQSSGAPAKKAPSPARDFLTWFQVEYKARRHGATYFVTWDKHMPIVGRLLKLHAPDRLRKHAQILLTTDEPWTETTDRGIEILAGKINWLEERLSAWEAKKKAREAI